MCATIVCIQYIRFIVSFLSSFLLFTDMCISWSLFMPDISSVFFHHSVAISAFCPDQLDVWLTLIIHSCMQAYYGCMDKHNIDFVYILISDCKFFYQMIFLWIYISSVWCYSAWALFVLFLCEWIILYGFFFAFSLCCPELFLHCHSDIWITQKNVFNTFGP